MTPDNRQNTDQKANDPGAQHHPLDANQVRNPDKTPAHRGNDKIMRAHCSSGASTSRMANSPITTRKSTPSKK